MTTMLLCCPAPLQWSIQEAEQEEAAQQQVRQDLSRQLSNTGSASKKGSAHLQELAGGVISCTMASRDSRNADLLLLCTVQDCACNNVHNKDSLLALINLFTLALVCAEHACR